MVEYRKLFIRGVKMSLVFCPECNQKVSQYADICPECGFPIKNLIDKQNITDLNKLFVCPKCAHVYYGNKSKECALHLKCEFCNTEVIQTHFEVLRSWNDGGTIRKEEEKIEIAQQYGNNQFSQEAYERRLAMIKQENQNRNNQNIQADQISQKPQIKCPYCHSTNTTKITLTKRSVSTYLFGLGSSKVGKQWHCNNCKSDF